MKNIEQVTSSFEHFSTPIFITDDTKKILFMNNPCIQMMDANNPIGTNALSLKSIDLFTSSKVIYEDESSGFLYIYNETKEEQTAFKELYEYTPLPYQNVSSDGVVLNINKAWVDKFGYDKEEVIGGHFSQYVTKQSKEKIREKFSDFLATGSIDSAEFDFIHKDQTISPVRVHGNIQYNESNQIEHTHCILQEISKEKEYQQQFIKTYEQTIYSFIEITEQKDGYTAGHSQRVAFYSTNIAERLGLNKEIIDIVYKAGMLHDIGKITIPEAILLKPGSFSNEEFQLMKEHPQSGFEILKPISMYDEIADIILHHHEHYDGSGYPFGKKGEQIPLVSQILAISDTFDAMTTNRIYKARKSVQEAVAELKGLSGKWFEENLLHTALEFLKNLPEIKNVSQLPKSASEKQRFSYFFKDNLTGVYNGDYLNMHLQSNITKHKFNCCNFIKLHNMSRYNTLNGWEQGNKLLQGFSTQLLELVKTEHIYRVYGDDFIVINDEHIDIDIDTMNNWIILKNSCVTVSMKHYDLRDVEIDSWQKLESSLE